MNFQRPLKEHDTNPDVTDGFGKDYFDVETHGTKQGGRVESVSARDGGSVRSDKDRNRGPEGDSRQYDVGQGRSRFEIGSVVSHS